MAQIVLYQQGSGNANMCLRVTYTADNGTLNITKVEGCRTDGYSTQGNFATGRVNINIGGTNYQLPVYDVYFNAYSNWSVFNNATSSRSGLSGNVTVTITFSGYGSIANINNSRFSFTEFVPAESILNPIPAFQIEEAFTLNIQKNVNTYTDNLKVSYGNEEIGTFGNVQDRQVLKFTQAGIDKLYDLTKNIKVVDSIASFDMTFLLTTMNGSTVIGTSSRTVRGEIREANPTLNDYTYFDINDKTVLLTGNNQEAIQHQSILRVNADGNYILNKGATFSGYVLSIIPSSGQQNVSSDTITPNESGNLTLEVKIKDSRGNLSNPISKPLTIYPYFEPIIDNVQVLFLNPTSNTATLKIKGNYSQTLENNLLPIKYRYKVTGTSTWYGDYTLNLPQTDGKIDIGYSLQNNFDNKQSYDFQIEIADKLFELPTRNVDLIKATPDFEIVDGGVKSPSYMDTNGNNILKLMYPVGSIYMSISSTNPSSYFGGTWEAWGTGRVPIGMGSNGRTNYTTVGMEGGSDYVKLDPVHMPSHNHQEYLPDTYRISVSGGSGAYISDGTNPAYPYPGGCYPSGHSTGYAGSSQEHENRQCFITCYMWKRTA